MRKSLLTALVVAGAIAIASPGVASAGGGNSAAAKLCQKGGWQNWVREDRTPFANQGACVSYAAKGGTLTSPKTPAQIVCEDFAGTYADDPEAGVVWSCTIGGEPTGEFFFGLFGICALEPGAGGLAPTLLFGGWRYDCRVAA